MVGMVSTALPSTRWYRAVVFPQPSRPTCASRGWWVQKGWLGLPVLEHSTHPQHAAARSLAAAQPAQRCAHAQETRDRQSEGTQWSDRPLVMAWRALSGSAQAGLRACRGMAIFGAAHLLQNR